MCRPSVRRAKLDGPYQLCDNNCVMPDVFERIAHTGRGWGGVIGGLSDALTDELTEAAPLGVSPKRRAEKGAS